MRIAVLGPLAVSTDDGRPVPVPGAKERLLLAALAVGAPGAVSVDALAEILWNGDAPVSARKSLQAHVVRLRSSLEPDRPKGSTGRYVVRRGTGYALTVDRGAIDRLVIGDLAARGHARLASGDPEEAERQLCAAVDLWRGEPYSDWPEAPFAEVDRRRLEEVRAGAVAGLLEARLGLGRHADVLPELERLVAYEPLREDWWRLLMLSLYRAGRQADALAAGRRVRSLLAEELGANPGPALREMEAAILAQDPALELATGRAPPRPPIGDGPAVVAGACPYKGLAAYQVADAPLFHGRKRLVDGLVARLVDAPLLVVSGPSGAGKSSVVRAGLVPALAAGALPDSQRWRPMIVTPGRAPVDVLAPLTGDRPPSDAVLLVCDQFEELWSPRIDPVERSAFFDALVGLIDDRIVVRCVVVVRGDHVGRLAEHPAFTERPAAEFALVPPLTDPELRQIVTEPARAVGSGVDPELLDAVVTDVLGHVGALPLLSTALVGTWERRRGDRLTLAGYLEAGGVAGALTRSAEKVFATLDETGQDLARRLFVRLADTDGGGALVRRPLPLVELDLAGGRGAARREVVETFVDRRLLAVDGDRLEVAHEALLFAWPRLVRWLEDDAAGRAVRRHLAPAAREWEAGGRPDDELFRGARLSAALDWADGPGAEVTALERLFVDASRTAADAELHAARDRADREAAARHRTRRLAIGLATALVVALVATVLAVRAQQQAQRASLVADANRLAALSTTGGTLDVALLLAAQAVRLADTPEAQDALLAALAEHGRAEHVLPFDGDPGEANLADDGRVLFFDTREDVLVWEVGPSTPDPMVLDIPLSWQNWVVAAPSPTDDLLLGAGQTDGGRPWVRTISSDGSTRVVPQGADIGGSPLAGAFRADGGLAYLFVVVPDGHLPVASTRWRITAIDPAAGTMRDTGLGGVFPAPVDSMAVDFADDGDSAVLWHTSGATAPTLIDMAAGRTFVASPSARRGTPVDFRALTSGVAGLWDDGAVTLTDGSGRPVQELDVHKDRVRDVVVAPDGTWAVTAGEGPAVILWDVDPGTGRWSQREPLTGHDGGVLDVAVDPSGRRLFSMSRDRTIISWDMSPGGGFGRSFPGLDGRWISHRPQVIEPGGLLVAPTRPGTNGWPADHGPDTLAVAATFLDPRTGAVVEQVVVGDTVEAAAFGSSVALSPDGSMVAITWGRGTTVLDTRTREVIAEMVLTPEGITDVRDGSPVSIAVSCAAWTPDGAHLLLCADDRNVVSVDTGTWEENSAAVDTGGAAQSIDVSPDERLLAVASSTDSAIVILDAADLRIEQRLPLAAQDNVVDLSFSPDGRFLAAAGEFGLLYVFDAVTWEPAWEPASVHDAWTLQTEWLRDGRTIATTGTDGTVTLFDVDRGLVRARPLRTSGEPGTGYAHIVPGPTDELVVLSGDRSGRRYSMDPSVWLDQACAIAGREFTTGEWERYLPGRDQEPTCTGVLRPAG